MPPVLVFFCRDFRDARTAHKKPLNNNNNNNNNNKESKALLFMFMVYHEKRPNHSWDSRAADFAFATAGRES